MPSARANRTDAWSRPLLVHHSWIRKRHPDRADQAPGGPSLSEPGSHLRVEIREQDCLDFGPELRQVKALIDECLTEWAADSRPEIRDIVTRAFNTDRPGRVNRSEIFMLLSSKIGGPPWQAAMRARVGTCNWRCKFPKSVACSG
ncbi:DUF3164 family protein [Cereibacter sphaeroides f. sp. denitrificans]